MEPILADIKSLLSAAKKGTLSKHVPHDHLVEATATLASLILKLSTCLLAPEDELRIKILQRVIHDEQLKAFVTSMIDSCFRTQNYKHAIDQMLFLARRYRVDKSLFWYEKPFYNLVRWLARLFPKSFFSLSKKILYKMTSSVILPSDPAKIAAHIIQRKKQGIHLNINRLGEAILGEQEAEKRLSLILLDLQNPLIEVVSVKISSIYSQITPLSYDHSLNALQKKLQVLFCACKHFRTLEKKPKFLYLDMEEYKDLFLTLEAFQTVLSQPDFFSISAGIALQSYIPDSLAAQEILTTWATTRYKQGGGTIRIRIVKGANLSMERVEASVKGWPQAPFKTKAEVDANFKKMLHYGLQYINAVHIAIASHNVFDIAYALLLRALYNVEDKISFEMLEGMCNHITLAVHAITKSTLLYCPTVKQEDVYTAMAYLIRRLDENTQKENFLTHIFDIENEPLTFIDQKSRFERSVIEQVHLLPIPRRTQDRRALPKLNNVEEFENEPDTDWSLSQNREFAKNIVERWKKRTYDIPCVIGSGIIFTKHRTQGIDPSRPGFALHSYSQASIQDVDNAIHHARQNCSSWHALPIPEKTAILKEFAQLLRKTRGEIICSIVAESGKTFSEADSEVSEAIDFANFYAHAIDQHDEFFRLLPKKEDLAFVATPWNFPCSIPTSSIIAPLVAGYPVIFKPAQEAALVGFKLVELFYQAGVPKEVLQFVTCIDDPVGSYIVTHPAVNLIMMTGATSTCRSFMKRKPKALIFGETGGKNCAIVTKMADRDLVVKEIIQSAFGYAGQKCSAMGLAIVDIEVYEDRRFLDQLRDAAASLICGSSWNFETKINPLIRPPQGKLLRAITELEPGEEWLLKPTISSSNPHLVTPGIKLNVQKGSFTHQTELFGPLLGIMSCKNLDEAIKTANATPYGLTAGLFSLDPREHTSWTTKIAAGNCYINKPITGAIVRRQPFGGCKASSFGIGMKAGGENYLLQLLDSFASDFIDNPEVIQKVQRDFSKYIRDLPHQEDKALFIHAASSYLHWMQHHFSRVWERDHLIGEDNFLAYYPHDHIFIYVQEHDSLTDCFLVMGAATIAGCSFTVGGVKTGVSTTQDNRFKHLVSKSAFPRFRALSPPPDALLSKWSERACCIDISKPKPHGRLELLHYLHEISISSSYHRYGNLLHREHEQRDLPL